MDIFQLLNYKRRGNKGILSHIADFLTIENLNLEQTNNENKELKDLEEKENDDIFKYIYSHDKL